MEEARQKNNEMWRMVLNGEVHSFNNSRKWMLLIPSNPRCMLCNLPFGGIGTQIMRIFFNKQRSNKNPNMCDHCEKMARANPGGAEVELTLLFADVRGSTTLAEKMSASDFSHLMNRFYKVANKVLVDTDAMIDKLVGDEVIGLYVVGVAGKDHAKKGLKAAYELLRATGHESTSGPWIPVGIGLHTGIAYVGSVGSGENFSDFTALGDAVNTTARLSSHAAKGEILITDEALDNAGVSKDVFPTRELMLKGKSSPITVRVIHVGS